MAGETPTPASARRTARVRVDFFGEPGSFKRLPCASPGDTIARMTPFDRRGSPESAAPLPTVIDEKLFAFKDEHCLILVRHHKELMA